MRIAVTSDFHWARPERMPECDLLIIAGDALPHDPGELDEFGRWLKQQPAREIVGIAGNHDYVALSHEAEVRALPWTYLQDEAADVLGVKMWGSPYSVPFGSWPFMENEFLLANRWEKIPDDTEILIVHGPARGVNDLAFRGVETGSTSLRDRIRRLPRLRLLVTGHIHEAYGQGAFMVDGGRWVQAVNGSFMSVGYQPGNPAIEVELSEEEQEAA